MRKPQLIIGFILIFSLGFFLRIYRLDTYGLYFDEKVTLLVSQGISPEGANQTDVFNKPFFTPAQFWKEKHIPDYFEAIARGDWGNSPLHYSFVHFWVKIFGISDFSVRFSSVFWSILLLPLIFIFTKNLFKNQKYLPFFAMFCVAVEPFFIAQSHILRNYSMSMFLVVLSTLVLFKILSKNSPPSPKIYFYYMFLVACCLMSHYLTFPVFVAHGVLFISSKQNQKSWYLMLIFALIPACILGLWLLYGGGKYSLKTMQDVATFYKNIAQNPPNPNPYIGMIDPVNIQSVKLKLIPVLADLFVLSNGLVGLLIGVKNLIISILAGILVSILLYRYVKSSLKLYLILSLIALGFSCFLYSINSLHFLGFSLFIAASIYLIFFFKTKLNRDDFRLIVLIFVPIVLMMVQVFKAGHTFSINQRYLAFCLPFTAILCGRLLCFWVSTKTLQLFLPLFFMGFSYQIFKVNSEILNDTSVKYSNFKSPRLSNPHALAAKLIEQQYMVGDTILLPNFQRGTFSDVVGLTQGKSVFDSQLINLYLCKKCNYLEKVNSSSSSKVFIIKKDGKTHQIFDFENKIY